MLAIAKPTHSLVRYQQSKKKAIVQNDEKSNNLIMLRKLILDSETKIELIEIEKITYITVDSIRSEIHFVDSSKCYSNKTLNFFESSLPEIFFRINRNTIVNLSNIENINKLSRQIQINGTFLCISARQLRNLANHLKRISARSTQNM